MVAGLLTRVSGRTVLNETGLKGTYNFRLEWSDDLPSAPPSDGDSARPFLFAAVKLQLGLKLEPAQAPLEVL
jgi:uncharacterized protein (TIGR03435 family)